MANMNLAKKIVCMRSVIFGYVVVLCLVSLAQIGLGSVMLWDLWSFQELASNNYWKPAGVLFGIGVLSVLLGWLGWNSTRKKNRCNLGLFCTLLLFSSFVQVYVAYWAHELRSGLLHDSGELTLSMDETFKAFFGRSIQQSGHIWNRIQTEYECCGVVGPSTYMHMKVLPQSCISKLAVHQVGCLQVIVDIIRRHLLFGALGALTSAMVQCIGSFCTLQLIMFLGRKPPRNVADPFKTELQKPLAERRRALESKSAATSSYPKSPAFESGAADAYS